MAMSARSGFGGRDDTDKNLESLGARDEKRDTSVVFPYSSSIRRISFSPVQDSFAIGTFRSPTSLHHNQSISFHAYIHPPVDAVPYFDRDAWIYQPGIRHHSNTR